MCPSPLSDFSLKGGKFLELRNIVRSTLKMTIITLITSEILTKLWESFQAWELFYHIWLAEFVTLFYVIPARPVWSWSQRAPCQLTKRSCNVFTVSSNPPPSVPPSPCSFIHTDRASHPKQMPHSTSTRALAGFSLHHLLAFHSHREVCRRRLTHLFPVPPSFRMHHLTPTCLISSPTLVSAPPTDLGRREPSLG